MIHELITNNYAQLKINAGNIVGKKKQYGSRYDARELISETFVQLEKRNKFATKSDKDFIAHFTKSMHLIFISKRSNYNLGMNHWALSDKLDWVKDEETNTDLTIDQIDGCPHLNLNDAQRLSELRKFKDTLPGHLKTIFELNIECKLGSREIAKEMTELTGVKTGRGSFDLMIKELRTKINTWKSSLV